MLLVAITRTLWLFPVTLLAHPSGREVPTGAPSDDVSRVDATAVVAAADSSGRVRCCCDPGRRPGGRAGLCVLVRGAAACGGLPKTSWAGGRRLRHYARATGGRCWLAPEAAERARARYGTPGGDAPEFPGFRHLQEIGPGFWNVRAPLRVLGVEVGTHMSLARLRDGGIVAIDTVSLTEQPGLREEIDTLTEGGRRLTAVLGTHPFHTAFFPGFHEAYPGGPGRQYYAAPRLLWLYPEIPWAGNITDVLGRWPDLGMLLPEGGDFVAPEPADRNHLMNVFVLHRPSRTVHNDDTVMVVPPAGPGTGPGTGRGWAWPLLSLFLESFRPGMHFHPSLWSEGLRRTGEAPGQFEASMERLLAWDFENLCSAHVGNSLGDARGQVRQLLDDSRQRLRELAAKYARGRGGGAARVRRWSSGKSDFACG